MQNNWEFTHSSAPWVLASTLIHLHISNKHNSVINVTFCEVSSSQAEVSSKMYL